MRIMLDTNVLISALLFPGTKMDAMMNYIFTNHQLVLSSYVVDELKRVVKRKFPGKGYKDSNGICPGQFLWRDGNNGIIQQRYTALDNFYFSSI